MTRIGTQKLLNRDTEKGVVTSNGDTETAQMGHGKNVNNAQ